jgi:NTP pyrophosphatase (non-canonical NTP hydrolase)
MIKPELLDVLIAFRQERDWEQFHKPKEVATALSIEASELLEWFLWRSHDEIEAMLTSDKREALEDEIADIAVYLSYLCHDLDIELNAVIERKMLKNAAKYPINKVKGKADKYNEYQEK